MPPKKKKSSTSLHISHPYTPCARTVRVRRNNDKQAGSSTTHSAVSASGTLGIKLPSKQLESDNSFPEYIENQTEIQHDDPVEANTKGKEKPKQRKRAKVMEEWVTYRDTYLQEMLRHDGREGLEVTDCAECGDPGDFSCSDCAYCVHYCQSCMVNRHRFMPFHRIRVSKSILSVV
jgi:hypothetical protein